MKKSKIILGCIISVMAFALTLLIGLPNKVYASEIDDYIEENYSNLVFSNNLFNFDGFVSQTMSTNGVADVDYENNTIQLTAEYSDNYLTMTGDIQLLPNTTYTFSVKSTGDYQLFVANPNWIGSISNNSLTFKTGGTGVVSFRIDNDNEIGVPNLFSEFMLNQGSQALPYEPYITGSMIYNQGYQQGLLENATSVLYKAFNGARANLIYNDNVVISDTINLTENDLYLSINNMTNIMIYLNNDETSRKYSLSISLNSAINNELVVLLNNSILDTSLTLSNSLGGYQESFSRAESSLNTIIANSQGRYFDTIIYNPLYPPDYINFKLNLDLSQLTFQEGYNAGLDAGIYEGYNKGSQEGYYKGYDAGKADGYNDGYNDGTISNIETNGFKTLFNSILSYPVNLISNVLDFEFMGVNIASLIMFIVSIGIVVFVVKKFW